jgi:hypothetical protein
MAQDPYKLVQQEIQSALQATEHLRASYLRIRSTARADSEELIVARNELRGALEALEGDLEELEGSVVYVFRLSHPFGLFGTLWANYCDILDRFLVCFLWLLALWG